MSETPENIGISKSMLFAYRGGQKPITAKAWAKLRDAEEAIGIKSDFVRYSSDLKDSPITKWDGDSTRVCEDVAEYKVRRQVDPPPKECPRIAMMERSIDVMSAQLELMREQLKQLKESR